MPAASIISISSLRRAIRRPLKKINFKHTEEIIDGFIQHACVIHIKRIPYGLHELFSSMPLSKDHAEYNINIDAHYDIGHKHYVLTATIYKGLNTTVFTLFEYSNFGNWDHERRHFITSFIWEHTYVNSVKQ